MILSENQHHGEQRTGKKNVTSHFIDRFIEKLPEMHIKGYNYCGPGTALENQLAQNVPCVNDLDCKCKEHDIAYTESIDLKTRYNADKILALKAFGRVYAKDTQIGERFSALIVSGLIGFKMILSKIELCIRYSFRKCLAMISNRKK